MRRDLLNIHLILLSCYLCLGKETIFVWTKWFIGKLPSCIFLCIYVSMYSQNKKYNFMLLILLTVIFDRLNSGSLQFGSHQRTQRTSLVDWRYLPISNNPLLPKRNKLIHYAFDTFEAKIIELFTLQIQPK